MTKKSRQNQQAKVKTGSWLLSQNRIALFFFYLLILFLPTQLGKHFWPNFSFISGLRLDYLSPTIYFTDVLIICIFVFSFSKILPQIKQIKVRYMSIFSVFIISLFMGLIGAKNLMAGLYGIIKFVEYSYLALFVIYNFKFLSKATMFNLLLAGIIFESVLAVFQYFNHGSFGGLLYYLGERSYNAQTPGIANATINGQLFLRPYATFSHPNVLSGFLIIAMLYLFIFLNNKKHLLVGILMGTITVFLTLSRIAIILWLVYLIILFGIPFVKKYKNRFSKLRLATVVGAVSVAVFVGILLAQNTPFVQRIISTSITEESLSQRIELAKQSMAMFTKNPIFGVGINNFFDNVNVAGFTLNNVFLQPVHNIFLFALSETGIIGIGIFFYLLFNCLKQLSIVKTKINKQYLLMLFFALIILGMFDHYFFTLQQGQVLTSIIFGTILSYGKK
jgi:hypothetical protein